VGFDRGEVGGRASRAAGSRLAPTDLLGPAKSILGPAGSSPPGPDIITAMLERASHRALPIGGVVFAVGVLALSAGPRAQGPKVDVLDLHRLPLGDGKVSSRPQAGFVYACQQRFGGGPGAQVDGPWIHGAVWDLTEKIAVQGRITWPVAEFHVTTTGDDRILTRLLEGNGLPVDTPTGQFPVAPTDPAFQIDRNPNRILAQSIALTVPRQPVAAAQPSCVPMGLIGVALNGVAIFNALDAGGRDAVAHEVQDLCNGHPEMRGEYHYHGPSRCLPNQDGNEVLVGYAADGFGIFSTYDARGRELTNADLDDCHGRVSEVSWDGARVPLYHYVLTREYPYTVGCFRGTPVSSPRRGRGQ
jgi:hypothetical protein